jgi:hypothetical protein
MGVNGRLFGHEPKPLDADTLTITAEILALIAGIDEFKDARP